MCRTSLRHCRDSWSEEQKALENTNRRISRNAAKRDAAETDGARAKYDALVAQATDQKTAIQATIDARKAEHFDERSRGEADEAQAKTEDPKPEARPAFPETQPSSNATDESVEAITKPLPAAEATPEAPPTGAVKARAAKEPSQSTRAPSGGGGRSGSGRRGKSETLVGMFLEFVIETRRQNAMHAALERQGIPHVFEDGFLHIAEGDWNESTYRTLQANGIKELPTKWGDDWSMPLGSYKGLLSVGGAA